MMELNSIIKIYVSNLVNMCNVCFIDCNTVIVVCLTDESLVKNNSKNVFGPSDLFEIALINDKLR